MKDYLIQLLRYFSLDQTGGRIDQLSDQHTLPPTESLKVAESHHLQQSTKLNHNDGLFLYNFLTQQVSIADIHTFLWYLLKRV